MAKRTREQREIIEQEIMNLNFATSSTPGPIPEGDMISITLMAACNNINARYNMDPPVRYSELRVLRRKLINTHRVPDRRRI